MLSREWRVVQGYQCELAGQAGLSGASVSLWCTGQKHTGHYCQERLSSGERPRMPSAMHT